MAQTFFLLNEYTTKTKKGYKSPESEVCHFSLDDAVVVAIVRYIFSNGKALHINKVEL